MKNKIVYLPLALVIMLGMAGIVEGACTFVTPASSGTISGATQLINITTSSFYIRNCTITATSAASGGTIATTIIKNSTVTGMNATNATISTMALRDASDYVITASCKNATAVVDTCTATAVTIDNTAPVIDTCQHIGVTAANGTDTYKGTNTVSCVVHNATTCSVYWKDTTADTMGSWSADTSCTFTASSSYPSGFTTTCSLMNARDGKNTWGYTCTDGADTTAGTGYSFELLGDGTSQKITSGEILGGTTSEAKSEYTKQQKLFFLMAVGGVLVFLTLMTILYVGKKKR